MEFRQPTGWFGQSLNWVACSRFCARPLCLYLVEFCLQQKAQPKNVDRNFNPVAPSSLGDGPSLYLKTRTRAACERPASAQSIPPSSPETPDCESKTDSDGRSSNARAMQSVRGSYFPNLFTSLSTLSATSVRRNLSLSGSSTGLGRCDERLKNFVGEQPAA